jgi:hypothetical protein
MKLALLALVALFAAQMGLNEKVRLLGAAWVDPPVEQQGKWNPDLFRAITFGHLAAGVDLLWLRTITDPAYAHVLPGHHAPAFYNLDLATDLDPAFYELYELGSYALTIVRDDNTGARDLLRKGIHFYREDLKNYPPGFAERYWTRPYSLYITLAYVYLYELNDMPSAAQVFREAAALPGAPAYLSKLKERLEKPGGEYEVALKLVDFLIQSAPDDAARDRLLEKKRSLLLARLLFGMNQDFESYRAQHRRSAQEAWEEFKQVRGVPSRDPWGGRLKLGDSGKIVSETPHEKVFGLE